MFDIDDKVASFLVKYMLYHKRIDLDLLKEEFHLSDKEVRIILIRLYNKNQVFGKIIHEKEKGFLVFRTPEEMSNAWGIKDILDCDKGELGINLSEYSPSLGEHPHFSVETWSQLAQDIHTASLSDLQAASLKESDQKGLILVKIEFKIITFYIALIITIQNKSDESIYHGKIRIQYPTATKLSSIKPLITYTIEKSRLVIDVGDVASHSVVSFRLLFNQEFPGIIETNGFFQFQNYEKIIRIFKFESIAIDTTLPIIKPCIINDEEVRKFMNNPLLPRKIQGFGFPRPISINALKSTLEEILQSKGFFFVSHQQIEQNTIRFFFGKAPSPKGEIYILVVPQMKNNIFSFYISCEYEVIAVNLLRVLCLQLQKYLHDSHFLQPDEQLIDMNCTQCGALLEIFPPKGELIGCKKCKLLQNPW